MTRDPAAARACVEELYAAHHAEIHSYLARMVGDDELAADLAQETFVKAYRAFDTLQDLALARAWLYRIAGRTALDELRRRKVIRFVPWAGETRSTVASAEETVLRGRLTGELERALAAIPERQRMALLLSELQELNGVELAAALDTSHDAARALLARARESLRQALAVERARTATAESRPAGAGSAHRLHLPGRRPRGHGGDGA